jgi:hypothetical protein
MYSILLVLYAVSVGSYSINDYVTEGCVAKQGVHYCYKLTLSEPVYDLNAAWMISYCSKANDLIMLDHFCIMDKSHHNCRYVFRGLTDFIKDPSKYKERRLKYCRPYIDKRHMDEDDDY